MPFFYRLQDMLWINNMLVKISQLRPPRQHRSSGAHFLWRPSAPGETSTACLFLGWQRHHRSPQPHCTSSCCPSPGSGRTGADNGKVRCRHVTPPVRTRPSTCASSQAPATRPSQGQLGTPACSGCRASLKGSASFSSCRLPLGPGIGPNTFSSSQTSVQFSTRHDAAVP